MDGMLSPYRVLDLTDEKGLSCGKLLGDLGADVIKVERPGGDPARMIGPFYHDEVHPEKSLFWWALNANKRGITLDIESPKDKETFKRLVRTADLVIESFSPGYLDRLGLGYSELEKLNHGIIMVSISPFGRTGPYEDYKAPDIVAWAMGGRMYPCGDADRPPVRISHHSQAYLHAGIQAAIGAMMALHYRQMTGEGQQVDVSVQEYLAQATQMLTSTWDMTKVIKRRGGMSSTTNLRVTRTWPCKDGYILWFYFAGGAGRYSKALVKWMDSEGIASDFIKQFDFDTYFLDPAVINQEIMDRLEEPTRRFMEAHTKMELLEGSVEHDAVLFPVSTAADILDNLQLASRDFWLELEHPELGVNVTYPGHFVKASKTPPRTWRRAPLIGEHNVEVYKKVDASADKSFRTSTPTEMSRRDNRNRKPLQGIKVADFSWWAVGTLTAKVLADCGAEVIKIEGRSRPDLQRTTPPFRDGVIGWNRSGDFNQWNAGKRSIALNLSHSKGKEIARKIIAQADIIVENFAGGTMKRMGLDYEELRKVKPDIIMLSTCMQGQTGPHATHPGFGQFLTALSGINQINGWPDREPMMPDGPYTDFSAPLFNALAVLAALDYRRRTGEGQYIDASQFESGVQLVSPLLLDYVVNGRVASRMGNRCPNAAPHNAYRCPGEDRWCAIAVFTDEDWQNFCKVVGGPVWTKDSRFGTLQARKENEDELDKLVEEWTMNHSAKEVMTLIQQAGVAAAVLQNGEDLLDKDPQLRHRHSFREVEHPEVGKYRAPGPSFILSRSLCEVRRAPLLGEHNEYVLKEVLHLSDEEITDLVIQGIIE